jgi:CheY-like chemotaxis protein
VLDLNDLVKNMAGMWVRLLGEDIQLVTRLHDFPITVKADPGQLEQILLNLAVNSRDAMPEGGQLLIETGAVELDASFTTTHHPMQEGRYALLAVSDTGIGMSEETRAHAFEPFYTTKEMGKGTGLGLSTVYGIVKQSGGFIWLYSEIGRGTTFKIYLPLVSEAVEPQSPVPASPLSLRGTETVLVAEDNAAVRLFARRALERYGYTVLEAGGVDAVEVVMAHRGGIALLLTDIVMPRISGPELAQALVGLRPDLRVLYMSGYTDNAIVLGRVLEAGMAYLQKPFTAEALVSKVREVLDGTGSRRAGER